MFHFFTSSSILAPLPVAMGDGVGAEWSGSSVGLCQGAVPVGASHTASLTKICVLLEAPQTSRPASQQSECRSDQMDLRCFKQTIILMLLD